jgi:predicted transcriptional regulator
VAKKRTPGRPKHTDDPPVVLSTTVPTSVRQALDHAAAKTGRPLSELLADAIRAYTKKNKF